MYIPEDKIIKNMAFNTEQTTYDGNMCLAFATNINYPYWNRKILDKYFSNSILEKQILLFYSKIF